MIMTLSECEDICKNYKIFVDTSALMLRGAEKFFHNFYPLLEKNNDPNDPDKPIILPARVINEIRNHTKSKENIDRYTLAKAGWSIIENLSNQKLLDIRGEENEVAGGSSNFADPIFALVFHKWRLATNLCLITQDTKLAIDILNIKYSQSVSSSKQMKILFINDRNFLLEEWEPRLARPPHSKTWCNTQTTQKITTSQTGSYYNQVQATSEKFLLGSKPLKKTETPLQVSNLPSEGEYVSSQKFGKVKLLKFIAEGGEGKLFDTDKGVVCKIYHAKCLTDLRKQKLDLMLSKSISVKGVCWPKDLVLNQQNQFVGYLMDKAQGYSLQRAVFGKPLLQNRFPTWKREHLVKLLLTIVSTIKELHDRNIIIGDINPSNILLLDENQVFFVDTDSYQIENFPCPVGTPTFTAPELQGINYSDILRTKEHEMFAVATLIFMVIFPGKTPYSAQGGEDIVANIKNHNFAYAREEGTTDKKPFGSWRFIWSHLHPELKKLFTTIFSEGKPVSIIEWLKGLGIYLDGIKKDRSSNELFPSSYHIRDGLNVTCKKCQKAEVASQKYLDNLQTGRYICSKCREVHRLQKTLGGQPPNNGQQPQQAGIINNNYQPSSFQSSTKSKSSSGYKQTINQRQQQPPKKQNANGFWLVLKAIFFIVSSIFKIIIWFFKKIFS